MQKLNPSKIVKNIFSISTGQAFSLIINFVSISLIARALSVDLFGNFNYLLAIATIISKLIDFGFVPIVFREVSQSQLRKNLINTAITLRLIFFVVALLLFNSIAFTLSKDLTDIILTNIFLLNIILSNKFQNFREILEVTFRVNLSMHIPMTIVVLENIFLLILVMLFPFTSFPPLEYFISIYVLVNLPGFVVILFILKKKYQLNLKFNLENYKWLIKESLPIFGYVALIALFQQLDIIFLKYFSTEYSVGLYSAAMRLTIPFNILPTALVMTIFPIIVRNIISNQEENKRLILLSYKLLFAFSFLLVLIISFRSEEIIHIVFGKNFIEASLATNLLLWGQVFLFFNFLSVDLFTAHRKQKNNLYYALLILIINTLLIFYFSNKLNHENIAMIKLASTGIGSLFIILLMIKSGIKVKQIKFRIIFFPLFLLGFVALVTSMQINIVVYSLIIFVVAVVSMKVLKFIDDEEMSFILNLILKKNKTKVENA